MLRREATERVGAAITRALAQQKKPQSWLGRELGVSQTAISSWCRGEALPTAPQLSLIDTAFRQRRGRIQEEAGIIDPPRLADVLASDPALDDQARVELLAVYDEQTFATARRRSRAVSNHFDGNGDVDTEEIPVIAELTAIEPLDEIDAKVAAAVAERLASLAPSVAAMVIDVIKTTVLTR